MSTVVADPARAGAELGLELVSRLCTRLPYEPLPVPDELGVEGRAVAYASPDSIWAVTRERLRAAATSILIGIYDFTAPWVRDELLAAVRRGVRVTVMVDLDRRKGEPEVWQALQDGGCECVPAPSCASEAARYFPSCHEKVVVVDDLWTLVQSGNYTEAGIPQNGDGVGGAGFQPGNRDMGLAVRSRPLAAFFRALLERDVALERGGGSPAEPAFAAVTAPAPVLLAAAPRPARLVHSRSFSLDRRIGVTPVISPENYLDVVAPWLADARLSVEIEQQYVRPRQPHVRELLTAVAEARRRTPDLVVRIVVAVPFAGESFPPEDAAALEELGFRVGRELRFLDPAQFVHCHNKLICVDRSSVLVGSQNWSDYAVSLNREAGLLVREPRIASYFGELVGGDWSTALTSPHGAAPPAASAPLPLRASDYVEL